MMVQPHDNNWLYVLRCDFQLRTKKIYDHIHAHHTVKRDLAKYESMLLYLLICIS